MHVKWTRPAGLYCRTGERKYLTRDERLRFLATSESHERAELRTFCLTLAHTGCRISEALMLTKAMIHPDEGFISIRCLKKRGSVVIRDVPVPGQLLEMLRSVHELDHLNPSTRLWPFSRTRAWQLVKDVMARADIRAGAHSSPKGLRHGFGLHAIRNGVPLHLVQRWLGHARMETTAIYLQVMGDEEREFAARMWSVDTGAGDARAQGEPSLPL